MAYGVSYDATISQKFGIGARTGVSLFFCFSLID